MPRRTECQQLRVELRAAIAAHARAYRLWQRAIRAQEVAHEATNLYLAHVARSRRKVHP